jgi:hypothetical protein
MEGQESSSSAADGRAPVPRKRKGPPMSEATKLKLKEYRANRIKNGLPPKRRKHVEARAAAATTVIKKHRSVKAKSSVPIPV